MAVARGPPYGQGVERSARKTVGAGPRDETAALDPAVRDASAILARAAADAAAADEARERYRSEPMTPLDPDGRIGPLLAPDELVLAVRRSAVLGGPGSLNGLAPSPALAGDLYVTSRRVVVVGRVTLSLDLAEIEDVGASAERLVLILRDGSSVAVQASQPRLLRVQIAAARAEARA